MKVNNVNGISDNICRCGSWLEHWKKFSKQELSCCCSNEDCGGKPELGAHVQKNSLIDASWYIVPLCNRCNGKKGESLTLDGTALVSADVSITCGV